MQLLNKECIENACSKLGYDLSEEQVDMVIDDLMEQGVIKEHAHVDTPAVNNEKEKHYDEEDEFETADNVEVEEVLEKSETLEKLFF